ncbi:MAG: PQQ-dependent sugar dehydrogenase, partial [Planctomycetota bacterium]
MLNLHRSAPPTAKQNHLLLTAAVLTGLGGVSLSAQNVGELFRDNCISCHGENYSGGSAPSLLDNDGWYTDGSDRELYNAIYHGLEDAGMPAYKGGLSEAESWSLVVYLREQRDRVRREKLGDSRPNDRGVYSTQHHDYRIEPIAEGLERPWAIDFLPDGTMLVTERPGRLRVVVDGQLVGRPVAGTPGVWNRGQGGLLDVAVDPDYREPGNGWIYLSYTEITDRSGGQPQGMTAVVRGRLEQRGDRYRWVDQQKLFTTAAEHAGSSGLHFGSRFVFGDDDTLFFSVGDRGQQDRAQQPARPQGKVHRIHRDGLIPEDNPFIGQTDAMKTVWSYGHRNPQGLVKHPATSKLYGIEHGPRGGDEINLVEPGNNYGWPVVSYSMNYNQTPFGDSPPFHADKGFVEPIHYWLPSIAQCGASFYTGDAFANWKHDMFVAALAKQEIRRVRLGEDGRSVIEDEPIFRGLGRVRDVTTGPDG